MLCSCTILPQFASCTSLEDDCAPFEVEIYWLVDRHDDGVGSREKFVSSKSIDEPGGEANLITWIQSV